MNMQTTETQLVQTLEVLYTELNSVKKQYASELKKISKNNQKSALNLLQYLTARKHDLRAIQDELHAMGLSSLSSSEGNFIDSLQKVLSWLHGIPPEPSKKEKTIPTLSKNSIQLYGEPINKFIPQIMVTYDKDFAQNLDLVNKIIHHGMAIARINCAHENEDEWLKMIQTTHVAAQLNHKSCKIYMDLPGPKIRTVILGKGKKDGKVAISEGELLWLAEKDAKFKTKEKVIGLTIENFVSQIKLGSTLLFDDGIIEAVVKEKQDKMLRIMIVRNSSRKDVIKSDKGVNFPDTVLHVNSLTAFDEACLPFILEQADMLGYSFVQRSEDIHYLYGKLQELGKPNFPVILKIETQSAVNQLPELLLTAMEYGTPGVMIARGDLAVEIGFERLSEIQDEILWICEAAHVPVIWATQVLENLNKSGIPTRAEITDAAHASMAECVMINKGENTVKVLKSLKEILNRNGRHHWKKRHMMRKLAIAENFFSTPNE